MRNKKRAYYFVLQLVQKWISGGGECQLLSTAAFIFLPRLHLLNDSNYSIQKLLPMWCIETCNVEGFMRNKKRETYPLLCTATYTEVNLGRRRMSAAINCCSYRSPPTSLTEPNKCINQSYHEILREPAYSISKERHKRTLAQKLMLSNQTTKPNLWRLQKWFLLKVKRKLKHHSRLRKQELVSFQQ